MFICLYLMTMQNTDITNGHKAHHIHDDVINMEPLATLLAPRDWWISLKRPLMWSFGVYLLVPWTARGTNGGWFDKR